MNAFLKIAYYNNILLTFLTKFSLNFLKYFTFFLYDTYECVVVVGGEGGWAPSFLPVLVHF